jgi:hypothetical protein
VAGGCHGRKGARRLMQFTRPATWDDVKTIARYFAEAGVEYALVGGYAIFTIDVMPSVAGLPWETLAPHIAEKDIDGVRVRLLDLEGLLKTKQGARPKDQMDAAVLSAALDALRKR